MKIIFLLPIILILISTIMPGCDNRVSTPPAISELEETPAESFLPSTTPSPGISDYIQRSGKYSKYFISEPKSGSWHQPHTLPLLQLDGDIVPGSLFFSYSFIEPGYGRWGAHGPHEHDGWEILGFISSNYNDPYNLDAEIILYMGEEMEPYTITKSTIVYIPPNTPHCPLIFVRIGRPIVFFYSLSTPFAGETTRKDLERLIPEHHSGNLYYPYEMGFPSPPVSNPQK